MYCGISQAVCMVYRLQRGDAWSISTYRKILAFNCTRQSIGKSISWLRKRTFLPSNSAGDYVCPVARPLCKKSHVHTVLGFRVPYSDATHSVSEQTGQRMPKLLFSYSGSYLQTGSQPVRMKLDVNERPFMLGLY